MSTLPTENASGAGNSLRLALRANGAFSLATGLLLLAGRAPIAALMGLSDSGPLMFLGLNLIIFAGGLFWIAARRPISRRLAAVVIALDLLWVGGSALLLASGSLTLTPIGVWLVVGVAAVVAGLAVAQYRGLHLYDQP